jgi:hypothetical protein
VADHNIIYYPTRGYPEIGITVPRYRDDIVGLIKNRQDVEAIISDAAITASKMTTIAKAYERRLEMLHLEWKGAIDGENFKLIEGSRYRIYRILITKSPLNLRVIFAFFIIGDAEKAVLLHAFIEGNKADYRRAITKAENRAEILVDSGLARWSEQ